MRLIVTLFILGFTRIISSAQGIEFFHGTWEETLAKAKEEDKIIFVDAFTTWCGPCKSMSANTFPNPEVGALFNQHFISVKIDMEKEMGLQFRKKFPVSAYPTLFFIDYDEAVVMKVVGAKKPPELIQIGESVVAKYDKSSRYEVAYLTGDRSYQLVYDYVAALNKAGKSSVKIANDYLGEQKDLTTEENLKFILEAASQVDCQCFDLFEKYKSEIAKVATREAIEGKVRQACANTVKRAIEYESFELITLAADAMKRHIPSEADRFRTKSEIQFALSMNDLSRIEELVSIYVRKHIKDESADLHALALELNKYAPDDAKCKALAIDLASKAAKDHDPKYIATYAQLVLKSGSKQDAIRILDEAIRKYDDDDAGKDLQYLKALKTKFENS